MGRVMRGDLFVCILDPVIQSQYKEGILAFLLLRCNICIVMLIMICLLSLKSRLPAGSRICKLQNRQFLGAAVF